MPLKFLGLAPVPTQEMVVDKTGNLTASWRNYLVWLPRTLDSICNRLEAFTLEDQDASLSGLDCTGGVPLDKGLYRATYSARISRPAGAASSLTVTFDWTEGGVAQSYSGAAIIGNTTTTIQDGTLLLYCDKQQPVTCSTTYVSNPPIGLTMMQYRLSVTFEKMKA